jgi:hypothetical protein
MVRRFAIVLVVSPIASSQVKVSTSATEYKPHQQIDVQITNAGKSTVSYCVEFGQVSFKAGTGNAEDIEHSPITFYVQKQNGRWGTLMIGPDTGEQQTTFSWTDIKVALLNGLLEAPKHPKHYLVGITCCKFEFVIGGETVFHGERC